MNFVGGGTLETIRHQPLFHQLFFGIIILVLLAVALNWALIFRYGQETSYEYLIQDDTSLATSLAERVSQKIQDFAHQLKQATAIIAQLDPSSPILEEVLLALASEFPASTQLVLVDHTSAMVASIPEDAFSDLPTGFLSVAPPEDKFRLTQVVVDKVSLVALVVPIIREGVPLGTLIAYSPCSSLFSSPQLMPGMDFFLMDNQACIIHSVEPEYIGITLAGIDMRSQKSQAPVSPSDIMGSPEPQLVALKVMKENSGSQFSPQVVDTLIRILEERAVLPTTGPPTTPTS